MRLGVVKEPSSNGFYRAVYPMQAMERRGHQVVWPPPDGRAELKRLTGCDVVHVYRRAAPDTQRVLTKLAHRGVAITYDNDDDFTAVPEESPDYEKVGGAAGRRIHAMTVKIARMAAVFTTTSETLAERYRSEGVNRIQVIPNQLDPEMARPRIRHDGLVIGWVAGRDHLADVARIPLADALTQLMARHRKVQVHCIGLDLELPQRYIHTPGVPFAELPQHVGAFDVGIAPLADIPANWARSDIKLKEYAASGVPWLASPIGPYVGLGEAQGGRLVADASWPEALEGLVARKRDRRRLARNGLRWASEQTVDAVADRWEAVFVQAKERSRRR